MKSSFVKNDKQKAKQDNQKVYFGQPQLDLIFTNNIKKSTLILIQQDNPTSLYISLMRYFIGSGVFMKQYCQVYDVFDQQWEQIIPSLLRESKSSQSTTEKTNKQESSSEQQNQEQNIQEKTPDNQNQIAWRYNEMDIKLKDENVSPDIPKLDLSKQADSAIVAQFLKTFNINQYSSLREFFQGISNNLMNSLKNESDYGLRKIYIANLFSSFSKIHYETSELIKFLSALKALVRSSHSLFAMSIPNNLDPKIREILFLNFDIVLSIDPIFENENFTDFQGLLNIIQVPNINNYLNFRIENNTWGIKASSQKCIEIDKLYQVPELDNIDLEKLTTQSKSNNSSSQLCSSQPSENQQYDF